MNSAEIRERFLRFFEARGHVRVASSSLAPANDPTLLFTNSGMVQFKDVFLGFDKRPYSRAVTSQRCLRAGGKHNDLANVGYTARHHTFFEMLGNFSFGDYFKEGAIPLAWEFLTGQAEGLGLDKRRLWITVFGGGKLFGENSPPAPADDDAYNLWRDTLIKAGFSQEETARRIARIPTADNFWMMGDTGPCGPCSEIFYNRDPDAARFEGDLPDKADQCVEVWNLVFMQYNRDAEGRLRPLPAPCVDTGMGLERISAVMQGVSGNYDTDIFRALSKEIMEVITALEAEEIKDKAAVRVIADHIRAAAFMIADGIAPSNEGRGYVLRRIIRRALYHGQKIRAADKRGDWFYLLTDSLAAIMGGAYPELKKDNRRIKEAIRREEEQFARTCAQGQARLADKIAALRGTKTVPGQIAFELYDTYGFPPDATRDYAMERGFSGGVNEEEFDKLMAEQRDRSRAAMKFKAEQTAVDYRGRATPFCGYDSLQATAEVAAIFTAGESAQAAKAGDHVLLILGRTPFYAEAGGQIGDAGELSFAGGGRARIVDARRLRADVIIHAAEIIDGEIKVGDEAECRVDGARRADIARNHSATHLMHAALRQVLGKHVAQKGSLVAADHLRFDFSHHASVDRAALREIEEIVNAKIRADIKVEAEIMPYQAALEKGATALFGEKYGDEVRVIAIDPSFSMELCGGTHVKRSGEIGYFSFAAESAAAAGIRRVEARTAAAAVNRARAAMERLEEIAASVKSPADKIEVKISRLQESLRAAQKQAAQLAAAAAAAQKTGIKKQARQHNGVYLVVAEAGDTPPSSLRTLADELRNELRPAAALLISQADGRAALSCTVDKNLTSRINAREWLNTAAAVVGGKGGGRDDSAQGAGDNPAKIKDALAAAQKWAEDKLA